MTTDEQTGLPEDNAVTDDTQFGDFSANRTIPAPPSDPLTGTLIDGRYLLMERLGEGGMGCVYRANHVLMDKIVAIKLIHSELAHMDEVAKRFEREARSSSRLTSPHCISVTDFGRTPRGDLYLVMELLEGEELVKHMLREGRLPVEECLRITSQILKGLTHAHQQGVIHRDLKPENIFLITHGDEVGFVKILDFGIAKLATEAGPENLTRSGMVFGTPKYLSPEQALGDTVDLRADLYSVGVILHEMLTGQAPYQADTAMEIMSMHLTAPLPLLSRYGEYPHGLQELLNRSMAKKPDYRYDDAAEFLIDIERIDPSAGPAQISVLERARNFLEPVARHLWNHPTARKIKKQIRKMPSRISYWQRLARQWIMASRRNQIIAAGGALLVFSLFVFAMCSSPDKPEVASFPENKPAAPPIAVAEKLEDVGDNTEIIRALMETAEEQLRNNQPGEAIITIKKALLSEPNAAAIKLLMGHAQFLSGNQSLAIFNYEQALKVESDLADDARLMTNLQDALERPDAREKAAVLYAKFGGETAVSTLAGLCNSALTGGDIRRAARKALAETGHGDRVNWLDSLTADFHEDPSCRHRKAVIAEMKQTGNPAFISLLEDHLPEELRPSQFSQNSQRLHRERRQRRHQRSQLKRFQREVYGNALMFNGFKLLMNPGRHWPTAVDGPSHSTIWTLAAAAEAATIAAVAVVVGQVASSLLGYETTEVAIQRAAVGLLCTFFGAIVMAPALSLALMRISENARAPLSAHRAMSCAMGFVWPAWTAGIILLGPPIFGFGPELGELMWMLLAALTVARILRSSAVQAMNIRRRWRFTFIWQTSAAFMLLFFVVPLAPAFIARSLLQVDSVIVFGTPETIAWPMPPTAEW